MSHFSNTLRTVARDTGSDQASLAARLRMNQSQLSKYFTGRAPVGPLVLEKILSVFPENTHATLVRAYLLDQIPPRYRDLLSVQIRETGGAKSPKHAADSLSHLPPEARDALRLIGSKCHERSVLDLVITLSRLLRGEAR